MEMFVADLWILEQKSSKSINWCNLPLIVYNISISHFLRIPLYSHYPNTTIHEVWDLTKWKFHLIAEVGLGVHLWLIVIGSVEVFHGNCIEVGMKVRMRRMVGHERLRNEKIVFLLVNIIWVIVYPNNGVQSTIIGRKLGVWALSTV